MKSASPLLYWTPRSLQRPRVVKTQTLLRRRWFRGWSLTLAVSLLFALFHVGTRVQVIETGYRIRALEEQQEVLKGNQHTLKLEVATLRSPIHLEAVAKKLGLKKPPEKQVTLMTARDS